MGKRHDVFAFTKQGSGERTSRGKVARHMYIPWKMAQHTSQKKFIENWALNIEEGPGITRESVRG